MSVERTGKAPVRVFKEPANIDVINPIDYNQMASIPVVRVGVEFGKEIVWQRVVSPVFVILLHFNLGIPKPFFAKRIELAEKQATGIAKKLA